MCVDPMTAAMMAKSAATIGQGVIGMAQGQAEKKAYDEQARQTIQTGQIEETQLRRQSRDFMARQRVAMLAGGGDIASGTNEEIASSDVEQLEMQTLMKRYGVELEAESLRETGRQKRRAGELGLGLSLFQAGSDALQTNQQWGGLK